MSFANNVSVIITICSDNMPEMRPLIHKCNMIAANREVRQGGEIRERLAHKLLYKHFDFLALKNNMIFTSKFITRSQHIPHCSVGGCQKDNIRQSSKKDLIYETTESRFTQL